MNFKDEANKRRSFIIFSLLSLLAGGINGFLGTGGGIVFIMMLSSLTKNRSKDNFATSLCATLIISLSGLFVYVRKGSVDFNILAQIGAFSLLGGAIGALLVDRIKAKYINLIFSSLIIYSGFNLLLK